MAGPGELAVVRLRVDEHRLRFEHLLPEAHHPSSRLIAAGCAGLAHVDDAAAQPVGPGGDEAGRMGAGERMAPGEPVAQALGGGPGQHGALYAADVGEECPRLKRRLQPADKIQCDLRRNGEHHQLGPAHRPRGAVGELGDRRGAERPHPIRSGGGEAHHPRYSGQARLPCQRTADGAQTDHRQRRWTHESDSVRRGHGAHAAARMRRPQPPSMSRGRPALYRHDD